MSTTEQTLREVSPVGGAGGERGWVYFAGCRDKWPIKIGWSEARPDCRVTQLQIGFPYPLELLAAAVGSGTDERRLHRHFANSRIRSNGEWFERTDPLLAVIAFLNDQPGSPSGELEWFLRRQRWTGPLPTMPGPLVVEFRPTPSREQWLAIRRERGKRLRALCED